MDQVPFHVSQWVDERYPKPKVDPAWLKDCYDWIIDEKNLSPEPPHVDALLAELEKQLLGSNLRDSMLHGTGLPVQIASVNSKTTLTGPPVLVEIAAITDVGVSAFQLEQIRRAREERMLAGVEDEEGQEDGDLEVEGEGPMPKYPRGTLSLQLFDGVTTLRGVEYKTLPQLSLETTPLGYKMQLKGVRIIRGIAHLEPSNVILKGHQSEADEHRLFHFKQNLRQRLGRPLEPLPVPADENNDAVPAAAGAPAPSPPPVHVNRSPLHDISPPPLPPPILSRNDDEDLEPRRRVPNSSSTATSSSTVQPNIATSPYFTDVGHKRGTSSGSGFPFTLSPTVRQKAPTLSSSSPEASDLDIDFASLDELEKEATIQMKPVPTSSAAKDKARAAHDKTPMITVVMNDPNTSSPFPHISSKAAVVPTNIASWATKPGQGGDTSSDDYGMDDSIGEDYLKDIDIVEMQALAKAHERSEVKSQEIITIEDDSDEETSGRGLDDGMDIDLGAEDKENVPVATRHVRRRTADDALGGGSGDGGVFGSQTTRREESNQRAHSRSQASQRTRPIVLATDPEDIIDISDSD